MKHIIGIDLGTTNSSVAYYDNRETILIPNCRGSRITPSVVAFNNSGEILIGESAKNQALVNRNSTILNVKRNMGTDHIYEINGKCYSPQEISSFILKSLKEDCEKFLGKYIKDAIITVPAYFTEKQRKSTIEAGRLAGFNVRKIFKVRNYFENNFSRCLDVDFTICIYIVCVLFWRMFWIVLLSQSLLFFAR